MVKGWVNKKLILERLKELADKSFQERLWMASSGPEISSFVEAVNQLYGDSGLDTAFDKNEAVFGKDIDDKLKVFGTALQTIPHKGPPMNIINNEKMIPIRKIAANIATLIEQQES
jgi:hypothetical protein